MQSKNVVGARRPLSDVYCVQVARGIDPDTSGAAVGVDFFNTASPEGNASAMINSDDEGNCGVSEFMISTSASRVARRSKPGSQTAWGSGCSSRELLSTRPQVAVAF
jgi:hypothetical protein